jgi:hypothetical protein
MFFIFTFGMFGLALIFIPAFFRWIKSMSGPLGQSVLLRLYIVAKPVWPVGQGSADSLRASLSPFEKYGF